MRTDPNDSNPSTTAPARPRVEELRSIPAAANTVEAKWDEGPRPPRRDEGVEGLMPHETTSTYTFGYRLVIGTEPKLEYEVSSGNWQLTSGHGDTFLNRVPPNSTTDFDLEFSGKASDGTSLTIEGSYTMGGTTYTFGPSSLGSDLTVTISNQVTCAAPVQHFAFTVKGTDASNKSYEYDPLMIMAANGGSCTEN